MEPFKVHILGCGSATPTTRHFPSSQVVEVRGRLFMVDCGEGTQLQLRRSRLGFGRLAAVFISHLHGDHCFGMPGMLSTFGLLGRVAPLHVYAQGDYGPELERQLRFFCRDLGYEVVFHAVDPTRWDVVYEDGNVTVTTIPLEHAVPCCGYLFREKPGPPHLRRDMLDFCGIPPCRRGAIKGGADWEMPDGTVVPNSRLTLPADPARSYAYCSDTRYVPGLCGPLRGVDLLYHESTYCDDRAVYAEMYGHSTARQAAMVARQAGAGRLVLGHYSSRYDDEDMFLREARDVFPDTLLAREMDVLNV